MTNLFTRAAHAVRNALAQDAATTRHLENTYVQVAMSSSFGGR